MRWDNVCKAEVIYKSLAQGNIIEKDGQFYGMGEEGDLCVRMLKEVMVDNKITTEEMWLSMNYYMIGLYRWCETFSDEEMVIIISNTILNDKGYNEK